MKTIAQELLKIAKDLLAAPIIKGTNLPETIIDGLKTGEFVSEDDVLEAIENYQESFDLDYNDPVLKAIETWWKNNKTKLLRMV